ncbi:MAG: T9SS type A sorting domain-containing protein [Bacteroidetes bacterium]|nr:T9SS type A sorting domain-containing protein [Bacteroidota bacterium]
MTKYLFLFLLLITVSQTTEAQNCNSICNGDFEDSIVVPGPNLILIDSTEMPCWKTTASNGIFEVWGTGFQNVPSYSGQQFVELNAQFVSTLYQNITANPGSLINIAFAHRGRWGLDSLSVSVGPVGGPYVTLGTFGDDSSAWGYYTLNYALPNVGTNFSLRFNSVYAAGGNPTVGNFLDDVSVTTSCIVIEDTCFSDVTKFTMADSLGFVAFQWSFDDPSSGPLNNAFDASVSHLFTAPGLYNVQLIRVFNFAPYSDTATYKVNINPSPVVNIGNDTTICSGQTIILQCSNVGSYIWQNGSTNFFINVNTTGTYTVTVTTLAGCAGTDSISVIVQPCSTTIANLAASDTSFCEKQCIDFFDLSTNGPSSWLWTFTGASPSTSTDQNPTGICYNNYGSFDVQLIACNSFGCDTALFPSFITEVVTPSPPTISQSGDSLICNATNVTYAWYNVNNPTTILGTNYFFVPSIAGQYYVVVVDSIGCDVSSSIYNSNVGMNENLDGNIQVLVNQNENTISINCENSMSQIFAVKLYDGIGREVSKIENTSNTKSLKLQMPTQAGTYILSIETNNKIYRSKIVVGK